MVEESVHLEEVMKIIGWLQLLQTDVEESVGEEWNSYKLTFKNQYTWIEEEWNLGVWLLRTDVCATSLIVLAKHVWDWNSK